MRGRLGRNFFYLTVSNLLSPLFSMALVLAISHLQGVEMLGKYSLLMTVFILGQACGSLGLPVIITREVAQEHARAGHYFVNATLLTTAIVTVFLLGAVPIAHRMFDEREMQVAMSLVLVTFLPSVVMGYGEAVLLALERAGDFVAVGLAENIVRACVGAALVARGYGIISLACSILAMRLLAVVGLLVMLRRLGVSLRARPDRALWRELLRVLPVVGSIPVVNQLYARSDMFLLSWFGTWSDVGLYSAGLRLVDLARTLPPAYGKAVYPILSRLRGVHDGEFAEVSRRAVRQSVLVVAPATFVLAGFANVLVPTIYGAKAAGGEHSLAVLAWSLLPLGAACALAQVLFAAGRQAVDLRVNVIATVVSVGTNLVLIPRFGAVGAALAMVVSMSLYAGLQYFWADREVVRLGAIDYVVKTVAVVVCAVLAVRALEGTSLPLAVTLGAGTFIVGTFVAGLVTRADLLRVRSMVVERRAYLGGAR
jgi:O-antigen/teichoic acid export membrane protein